MEDVFGPSLGEFECQGQGHQGQKTAFLAFSVACMRFMFGKVKHLQPVVVCFSVCSS